MLSVGLRLKEERARLGRSQTDLATIAGVRKGTQISWEKDASSPTAQALAAFAEAGADVLYILTGRRAAPDPNTGARLIEDDLASIRRDLVEQRDAQGAANRLKALQRYDSGLMTPAQASEIAALVAIAGDPARLAAFRAADFAQNRKRREQVKADLLGWFDPAAVPAEHRPPGEPALGVLATLVLDYTVPDQLLAELVHDLRDEAAARLRDQRRA